MTREYFSNDQRTIEQLLSALTSENWAERRDAARVLGYRGHISAVAPLIQALNDTRADVRNQAILSLGMLGDRRAIAPLVVMFSNPNHAFVSARALSWIKSRRVVKPLIAGLKSDNKTIRLCAAEVLGEIADPRAVQPLIEALSDEDNSVCKYAALSLGKLKDRRAVSPLLAALRSKDKKVQNNTAVAWYEPSDEEVQASTIIALGDLGDNNVVEFIVPFLRSENRELVYAATHALGELRSKVAFQPLLEMLNNPVTAAWMGHFAAVALGKIGDTQAFDPLITALCDKDVMIRIAAADGLGYLGDLRALPNLRLARKNDNGIDEFGESVSDHAAKAIRRIQRYMKKSGL